MFIAMVSQGTIAVATDTFPSKLQCVSIFWSESEASACVFSNITLESKVGAAFYCQFYLVGGWRLEQGTILNYESLKNYSYR